MREKKKDQKGTDESPSDVSRRDFIALSSAGVLDSLTSPASGHEPSVIETDVKFNTPDGTCDAAFFHPKEGSHPGVLIWPDSLGLRPALRELGRKIAAEGYSALVPNHLYRRAKAPVFDKLFDMKRSEDREEYFRILDPFLAPGAAERDAAAFVDFLDALWQVNKRKKIGTHGYCLGGAFVLKTAAVIAVRVGAGASFHRGKGACRDRSLSQGAAWLVRARQQGSRR